MLSMSKAAITRLFLVGVAAAVVGAIILLTAVVSALASGLIVVGGPTVVAVDGRVAWTLVGPLAIGAATIGVGAIAAVVAWVGALSNTVKLADKRWFATLLVLGLSSFGWLALVAYVVAGPDGTHRSSDGPATGQGATI